MERCVVVSLERRRDRLDAFLRQPGVGYGWPFPALEVVPGVDRPDDGMAGCRDAHLREWRRAVADQVEWLWIFEDDAELAVGFGPRVRRFRREVDPLLPEAIYLGGEHLQPPQQPVESVAQCTETIRTHAYGLHRSVLPLAVATVEASGAWFDHALAWLLGPRGRCLAPDPFLAHQREGAGSDCGH